MQTSKATIFWPSISSYQEKDAYANTCKNQFSCVSTIRIFIQKKKKNLSALSSVRFSGGGGQAAQASVSSPLGGKLPRGSFSPGGGGGGKMPRVGGKIHWGINPQGGGQAAQGAR